MKEIPLSRGLFALVDDEDFERLSAHKWYAATKKRRGGRTVSYAVRNTYTPYHTTIFMHREILPAPPGVEVDHIDGDGLNNLKANLRHASRLQNLCARRFYKPASGYRGVCPTPNGRWSANLVLGGRRVYCRFFDTAEEAARARDMAALEYHGQFAWLNFPELRPNPIGLAGPQGIQPERSIESAEALCRVQSALRSGVR